MKKTDNMGTVFLMVLAVSLLAVALIIVAVALFGIVTVFTTAVCLIPVFFAWIIWTNMVINLVREQGKIESQDSIQPMSNIDYEEMQSDVHKNTK
jgi:adenylate kinase